VTRLAWLAAACVLAACTDARPRRGSLRERLTKDAAVTPATTIATTTTTTAMAFEPVAAICTDTAETAALRCAEGVAKRSGDTIIIRLSNVGAAKRTDHLADGDGNRQYYYAGRFGGDNGTPAFHILDVRNGAGEAIELINAATGDSLVVHGVPILSPDGGRFVAVADPEACALPTQLDVWRVTGDKPVQEYSIRPFNCTASTGWGPSDVTWRARDTISFLRATLPADSARRANGERDETRALLVRVAGRWTLDTTAAARRFRTTP
jgi:hypothetical protein